LLDKNPGNKLISPFSIYLALSMVCNGAAQATQDSIRNALRLQNIDIDDLNSTCLALMQQLPHADSKVTLSVANSIWYRQTIQPVPAFLDKVHSDYLATVQALNFNDPNAPNAVNSWVSDHTQQKIPKIISGIPGDELMLLINAIYFKGTWKYPFSKSATAGSTFYRPDNTTVTTPFMSIQHGDIPFFQNDSLQMAQLPYAGGNFNMFIISPSAKLRLADFLPVLNTMYFQSLQSRLNSSDILLNLPKFRYSYSIDDMRPSLSSMGMGIAFGSKADFSRMYTIPVYISQAIHKAYIEVNEEGTEAAAATAIGIVLTAAPNIPIMSVDHPFVYIIQEKTSGAILFTGVVNDPSLQ
ncbi:MAG TPA: serpin family protein, partial [Puia sp.]|nr:serpin family protein [Puia sp.]